MTTPEAMVKISENAAWAFIMVGVAWALMWGMTRD